MVVIDISVSSVTVPDSTTYPRVSVYEAINGSGLNTSNVGYFSYPIEWDNRDFVDLDSETQTTYSTGDEFEGGTGNTYQLFVTNTATIDSFQCSEIEFPLTATVPTSQTITGTVSFAGSSNVSVNGTVIHSGVVDFGGSSDVSVSVTQTIVDAVEFAGSGSVDVTGTNVTVASAELSGSSDVDVSGTGVVVAAADLQGSSDLEVTLLSVSNVYTVDGEFTVYNGVAGTFQDRETVNGEFDVLYIVDE